MTARKTSPLFFITLLCCWTLAVLSSTADYSQPTSQPTAGYVAPTVPEEYIGGGLIDHPSCAPTVIPSPIFAPTTMKNPGETFEEEIVEENRTAITTSSYMFLTFVALVGLSMLAYISKRYCCWGASEGVRYQQVQAHDPDEFFSHRNVEMANRGVVSASRHL